MYGLGDYFARGNPCIPESTAVPPAILHEGGGYMYGLGSQVTGLNGCGCNGECGSCGGGLGLFDNFSLGNWGIMEWGAVAVGAFVLYSVVSTTGRGVTRVRKGVKRVRKGLKSRSTAGESRFDRDWVRHN